MADYGTRTKPRHERHSGEPHALAPPKHSKQRDKGKDTCDTVTAGTGEKERVPAHVTRVSAARVRRAPVNLTLEGTLSVNLSGWVTCCWNRRCAWERFFRFGVLKS